jgi:hypothetical protein
VLIVFLQHLISLRSFWRSCGRTGSLPRDNESAVKEHNFVVLAIVAFDLRSDLLCSGKHIKKGRKIVRHVSAPCWQGAGGLRRLLGEMLLVQNPRGDLMRRTNLENVGSSFAASSSICLIFLVLFSVSAKTSFRKSSTETVIVRVRSSSVRVSSALSCRIADIIFTSSQRATQSICTIVAMWKYAEA